MADPGPHNPPSFPMGGLPPPAREAPRICWGVLQTESNPIQTVEKIVPRCDRVPLRGDQVTMDKDLVTCPLCRTLAGLAPAEMAAQEALPPPGPTPLVPPGSVLPGSYRRLLDCLNVEQLEAKKADLEGELRAVDVLLQAARARHAQPDPEV